MTSNSVASAAEVPQAPQRLEALRRLGRTAISALSFLGVGLLFLISPMMLYDLGISYGDAGGIFLEKVHPGAWLVMVSLLLIGFSRGNPFTEAYSVHSGSSICSG